jgi:two-component system, OmpR family, response regulator MprA
MTARILIVDDEPYVRELIRETLRARQYVVDVASNGIEALEVMARDPHDIVVTDVVMPGMGGLDLIKHLKKAHPHVRVIVLTGFPRDSDIGDFLLQGADEFLPKPFRGNDLLSVIRRTEERIAAGSGPPGDPPGRTGPEAPSPGR